MSSVYLEGQAQGQQDRDDQHSNQAHQHEELPPGLLDQHQGYDRHEDIHGPHTHCAVLGGLLCQAGGLEDFSREEDDLKNIKYNLKVFNYTRIELAKRKTLLDTANKKRQE